MSSILFCTPCYGGMAFARHMMSCMNLKEELTKLGIGHDWLIGEKESLVHRARMEMTATFLKTDHTHMMWLDADIEFSPEDVAKVWNMDADIGVGVYAMKKPNESWYAAWKDGKLVKNLDQFDGPIEVDYAGTGFMLIKRSAIEKIIQHKTGFHSRAEQLLNRLAGPNALSVDEETIIRRLLEQAAPDFEGASGRVPALYMTPIYDDGLESEDYHFTRVARDAGLKVMMDPSVRLKHWGLYAYGS